MSMNLNEREQRNRDETERVEIDGYTLWHTPEFQALLRMLGFPMDLDVTDLVITVPIHGHVTMTPTIFGRREKHGPSPIAQTYRSYWAVSKIDSSIPVVCANCRRAFDDKLTMWRGVGGDLYCSKECWMEKETVPTPDHTTASRGPT